jgi:predicted kinase
MPPTKPFLVIVCGLTGSGKSVLARALGDRLGMPVINSDAVRKQMVGNVGKNLVPFQSGIYSQAMTERTYAGMADLAEQHIPSGEGAILDGTFHRKANWEKILELAERYKVFFAVIRCYASDETTRSRLAKRLAQRTDISDGRWEIYQQQKEAYEPMEEIPESAHLELNTAEPVEDLVRRVERFLRLRF